MKKLLIVFIGLLMMVGCKTHSELQQSYHFTDSVRIHDSIRIKDSVRIMDSTRIVTKINDSTRIKDSTVVVVDEQGNVKSKETWHERDHWRKEQDSTLIYKNAMKEAISQRDMALYENKELQDKLREKKTVEKKSHSLFDYLKIVLASALAGYLFARRKEIRDRL